MSEEIPSEQRERVSSDESEDYGQQKNFDFYFKSTPNNYQCFNEMYNGQACNMLDNCNKMRDNFLFNGFTMDDIRSTAPSEDDLNMALMT